MTSVEQPVVLVVGDANPDLVLRGDVVPAFGQAEQLLDSADLVLGGSASIVACGLARLGVPSALAAVVGSDHFGDFVRECLDVAGVDTRWLQTDPATPTGLSVILSGDDRAILTHPGTIATTTSDVVDVDLLTSVRHVHSASYFLQPLLAPDLPSLLRAARSAGATTSVDTNWDPGLRWTGVRDLLTNVDVFLPNAAELLSLTDESDLDAAAAQLVDRGMSIACKNGADGGVLWEPDGARSSVRPPLVDVVDTTGAGDSFDAGFISALVDGLSGADCLARAVVCGALSTRAGGGTRAQATYAEAVAG